jgi:hypothetical protein
VNKDDLGMEYAGETEVHSKILKWRIHPEYIGVNGIILLKWVLRTQGATMCSGLIWRWTVSSGWISRKRQ